MGDATDGVGRVDVAAPAEAWTVATFDLVGFALLLLLPVHLSGALGDALAGLGTVPGLLLFGYLWVLVAVSVRWVLADGGLVGRSGPSSLLARGALGGACVGSGFVAGVVIVGGAVLAIDDPSIVTSLAVFGSIAVAVAAIVGAVVGALFAVVNVALARVSEWVVPLADADATATNAEGGAGDP
ncbi:hypothetical protein [Halobellus rufus]|uniref:hypothetical protein n=1 Tax=Halobellus rufus TaxID=1448860 RepID=UPI0006787120|nr:hypothetical protein [Halobellus rufus]